MAWPYQRRRWESNPLELGCSRLPCHLAPASFACCGHHVSPAARLQNVLAGSRTWSSTFAGSRARFRHTPRTFPTQRPAEELNPVLQFRRLPCCPTHPQGDQVSRPGIEPGPGASEAPMRSATPSGHGSRSRRLDLHQHRAVYRTAAFLFGHVGTSSSAGSRTPRGGFGDRLLARKHTAMAPGRKTGSRRNDYFCNATFQ